MPPPKTLISPFLFALSFLNAAPVLAKGKPCVLKLQGGDFSISSFRSHSGEPDDCKGELNGKFKDFKAFMADTQVIAVAGFKNEKHDDYFGQLKNETLALGGAFVPAPTNSERPVNLDMEKSLCSVLSNLVADVPKGNVILIGHSKGGASLLYAFAVCPAAVQSPKIKAIVSMNGVIRGSTYADYAVRNVNVAGIKVGPEVQAILTKLERAIDLFPLAREFLGEKEAGLSLTTRASQLRLDEIAQAGGTSPKVFCVTTSIEGRDYPITPSDAQRLGVQAAPVFRGTPNDGLVDLLQQYDPKLCPQKLNVKHVSHISLVEADSSDDSVGLDVRRSFAAYLLYTAYLQSKGQ